MQLNRADLERLEYSYVLDLVGNLIIGVPLTATKLHKDTTFYRGVRHEDKPNAVSYISYPRKCRVKDYQRCNKPMNPMFYCSADPVAIYYEIQAKPGDKVYLSKWSLKDTFVLNQIAPNDEPERHGEHALRDTVLTFLETKFMHPVHDTFSSQYKITAAVAEVLGCGDTKIENPPTSGLRIGGISYPSVAHPMRAQNMALLPNIVDQYLHLESIDEFTIDSATPERFAGRYTDFASDFPDGHILWTGQSRSFNFPKEKDVNIYLRQGKHVYKDSKGTYIPID